jgi:hypothetical protein
MNTSYGASYRPSYWNMELELEFKKNKGVSVFKI